MLLYRSEERLFTDWEMALFDLDDIDPDSIPATAIFYPCLSHRMSLRIIRSSHTNS